MQSQTFAFRTDSNIIYKKIILKNETIERFKILKAKKKNLRFHPTLVPIKKLYPIKAAVVLTDAL